MPALCCPYCETPDPAEVLPRRPTPLYQCRKPGCRLRFSEPRAGEPQKPQAKARKKKDE